MWSMCEINHLSGGDQLLGKNLLAPGSTAEFAQVICDYLREQQIELIGSFRITLEDTGTNLAKLSVIGEFNKANPSSPLSSTQYVGQASTNYSSSSPEMLLRSTFGVALVPDALGTVDVSPAHAATKENAAHNDLDSFVPPCHQTCDEAVLATLLANMPKTPPYFDDAAMEDVTLDDSLAHAGTIGLMEDSNAFDLHDIAWTEKLIDQSQRIIGAPNDGTENYTDLRHPTPRTRKRKHTTASLSAGVVSSRAQKLAQVAVRGNVYEFLEAELPRWTTSGLWRHSGEGPQNHEFSGEATERTSSTPYYAALERAYSTVVRLDSRMGDDVIRNRAALIQLHVEYSRIYAEHRQVGSVAGESSVGRGAASGVIDEILSSIHDEWHMLDKKRQSALRAKFHDRKKYGKRWYNLAAGLGNGILLVSSSKLAVAVRCTSDSAKTLSDVVEIVRSSRPATTRILSALGPLAECLLKNEGYTEFNATEILRQVYDVLQK